MKNKKLRIKKYNNIYPFVEYHCSYYQLKDSKIYKAIYNIEENNNNKNFQELYKQYCFGYDNLIHGCYRLGGWYFDLKKYCKCYLVNLRYEHFFRKLYAPNKTSLYNAIGSKYHVIEIYELKKGVINYDE